MPHIIREKWVVCLEEGWGTYVTRFQHLSSPEQEAFLRKQGYTRLADLLAHVVAWWEEAYPAVKIILVNPDYQTQDYDVDDFNARAVKKYRHFSEVDVIQTFEAMRQKMLDLVNSLPEESFNTNAHLVKRLDVELVEHLHEHAFN